MQTDPIGYSDGPNWYQYAGDDPIDNDDPTGESCGPQDPISKCDTNQLPPQVPPPPAPPPSVSPVVVTKERDQKVILTISWGGIPMYPPHSWQIPITLPNWVASKGHGDSDNAQSTEDKEETPETHPEKFKNVRGKPGKEHVETGAIWEKDKLHKDHYEVYHDKKAYENGTRDRAVWSDGRLKQSF